MSAVIDEVADAVLPPPNEAELAEITALLAEDKPAGEPASEVGEQEQIPLPAEETTAREAKPEPEATAKPEPEATEKKLEAETKPDEKDEYKDDPKLSKFENAKRREAKAWQKIKAREAELEKQQAEVNRRLQEAEVASRARSNEPALTPEQCEAVAAAYEQEGKFELAENAKAYAARLRAEQQKRANAAPPKSAEFVQSQRQWWEQAKREYPDVVKKGSRVNTEIQAILNDAPELKDIPRGYYYAATIAELRVRAEKQADLMKEAESLRAENKKLKAQTEVEGGGSPVGLPKEKTFEQMSANEQEAFLRDAIASTPFDAR